MIIKQKAKAYDKAIKVARSKIKNNKDHVLYEEDITDIFPELKEREDMQIMKEIAEFIYNSAFKRKDIKKKEKWLAWLEKQGEQKPDWSEEDEWKFSDILALLRGGESCHYNTPDLFEWLKSLKSRIQPKQEWSEEDKNRFSNLIFLVKCSSENEATKKGFIDFINRIKSLRPQPKNEWSEEDKNILNGITSYLCTHDACELDGFDRWYHWLESLKDRLQPKVEWNKKSKQVRL